MVWLDSTRTESENRDVHRHSLHERRWGAEEHDFAAAWRSQPKWVVSRTLKSVGPNATLVEDDIEAVILSPGLLPHPWYWKHVAVILKILAFKAVSMPP